MAMQQPSSHFTHLHDLVKGLQVVPPLAVCVPQCYFALAGAALVKYGELLLGEVPFSHNLGLALTMVIGPCLVFSAILAARFRP